jgi:hypothetical protein
MPYSVYELRPLVVLVQAWNEKGDYIHVVANLNNKDQVQNELSNLLGKTVRLVHLRVDASILAHKLPGIHRMVTCPVTKKQKNLFSTIIDLNDTHNWSREKIADWIETLDDAPKFEVS